MKIKFLFSLGLMLSLSIFGFAQASNTFSTGAGAIKGYDPVAYFTDHQPVKGNTAYKYEWNGATWYFASRDHLSKFKANPTKYAPQYGGYCAYGMANDHKAPIDADAWSIIDGKLYLNYSTGVQKSWKKDEKSMIIKADANWAKLKK
jgi:YHS domain-containing protein